MFNKKISIIGFGRFGKTLYRLLKDDFQIQLFDNRPSAFKNVILNARTKVSKDLKSVYNSDVVFYAVPISSFAEVIRSHFRYFRDNQLLIDVLSVKIHPQNVFKKQLFQSKTQAILTHPMFGPDSSIDGFDDLSIMMNKFQASDENYLYWKEYFTKKGLLVVELTAEQHDRMAANSQGVTHFIGRILEDFNFEQTSIDTLGAKKLQEVRTQTCNDTWELFSDLQSYNPYTNKMRLKLGKSYNRLYNMLLPGRVDPK